jgi:peptidoglycan/LPS O-acetylase OafA/YrhL
VGAVSFSLYLWHYPVLYHGLRLFDLAKPGTPALAVAAGLVVLVAVSGALAALSYRWVERPARRPVPEPAPVPVRFTNRRRVGRRPARAVGAGPVTPLGR